MGAIRLLVMVLLICAVVAWGIGQRERIADAAQSLAQDLAQEVAQDSPQARRQEASAPEVEAGDARTKAVPEAPSDDSAEAHSGDTAEAPSESDAEEPVVVARAGSRSEPGVEDHTPIRGLRLQARRDGHFYLEVQVNGARIPFLVDTGATSVMLTKEAARRARITPKRSDYTMKAQTANGTVRMAPVTLRDMRVGAFRATNVAGAVNSADSGISLLGMSFLRRLSRYEVKDDELILYW